MQFAVPSFTVLKTIFESRVKEKTIYIWKKVQQQLHLSESHLLKFLLSEIIYIVELIYLKLKQTAL